MSVLDPRKEQVINDLNSSIKASTTGLMQLSTTLPIERLIRETILAHTNIEHWKRTEDISPDVQILKKLIAQETEIIRTALKSPTSPENIAAAKELYFWMKNHVALVKDEQLLRNLDVFKDQLKLSDEPILQNQDLIKLEEIAQINYYQCLYKEAPFWKQRYKTNDINLKQYLDTCQAIINSYAFMTKSVGKYIESDYQLFTNNVLGFLARIALTLSLEDRKNVSKFLKKIKDQSFASQKERIKEILRTPIPQNHADAVASRYDTNIAPAKSANTTDTSSPQPIPATIQQPAIKPHTSSTAEVNPSLGVGTNSQANANLAKRIGATEADLAKASANPSNGEFSPTTIEHQKILKHSQSTTTSPHALARTPASLTTIGPKKISVNEIYTKFQGGFSHEGCDIAAKKDENGITFTYKKSALPQNQTPFSDDPACKFKESEQGSHFELCSSKNEDAKAHEEKIAIWLLAANKGFGGVPLICPNLNIDPKDAAIMKKKADQLGIDLTFDNAEIQRQFGTAPASAQLSTNQQVDDKSSSRPGMT